jgi:hypothetical protein
VTKATGEEPNPLGLTKEVANVRDVFSRLSTPSADGLTDNMLSRTDSQISLFSLPQGELSLAPVSIRLRCAAVLIGRKPEQACVIVTRTKANATTVAVMTESFFSIFRFNGYIRSVALQKRVSIIDSRETWTLVLHETTQTSLA